MKSRFITTCLNCGKNLSSPPKVFQGVLICDDCYKIVSHCIQRTKTEMNMLFLVYTDMLRVALVKGELRPSMAPPAGKTMPPLELSKAFRRLAEGGVRDGTSEETDGKGQVSDMRKDQTDRDGEVRSG